MRSGFDPPPENKKLLNKQWIFLLSVFGADMQASLESADLSLGGRSLQTGDVRQMPKFCVWKRETERREITLLHFGPAWDVPEKKVAAPGGASDLSRAKVVYSTCIAKQPLCPRYRLNTSEKSFQG